MKFYDSVRNYSKNEEKKILKTIHGVNRFTILATTFPYW